MRGRVPARKVLRSEWTKLRTLPYAGGRRLGLAVALLGDPEVLLLDEPLTGLGPGGVRLVRELLRDFAAVSYTHLTLPTKA